MSGDANPTSLLNRRDGSVHNPLFKTPAEPATRDASILPENRNLNCNGPIPLIRALGDGPDDTLSNATSSDPPSLFGRHATHEEATRRKRLSGGSVCLAMLMIIVVAANIGFIYFNMFKTKICKIEMRN